jgi:hypothetical protein
MHKLLMLSRAYQMSSAHVEGNAAIDHSNEFFWKFNSRRLSAEEIRDAMMFVSGDLDLEMAGPHPFPPEREWRYTQHEPFVADYPSRKRSIYLLQQRIRKNPLLESFDAVDANATTGERPLTTTALQALFMMNSKFIHEQGDKFAVRVGMAFTQESEQIDYAHQLAFGRRATADELRASNGYIQEAQMHLAEIGTPLDERRRKALGSYLRVLLSSSEFLFVD